MICCIHTVLDFWLPHKYYFCTSLKSDLNNIWYFRHYCGFKFVYASIFRHCSIKWTLYVKTLVSWAWHLYRVVDCCCLILAFIHKTIHSSIICIQGWLRCWLSRLQSRPFPLIFFWKSEYDGHHICYLQYGHLQQVLIFL